MSKLMTTAFVIFFLLFVVACVPVSRLESSAQSDMQKEAEQSGVDRMERNMALIAAAGSGDIDAVKTLIEQGADVHASNAGGVTPLIAASYQNHVDIAKLLINAGADVNVQDVTAGLKVNADLYAPLLCVTGVHDIASGDLSLPGVVQGE